MQLDAALIANPEPTELIQPRERALDHPAMPAEARARLHAFPGDPAREPVLLNFGEPAGFDITPWADRVQLIDATYVGPWELPVIGAVTAPSAVLIRPDGHVAWVGDPSHVGLIDALTTWFGLPRAM